jgi:uncharacterized membrane protein YkvA (DUF1232 family)
MEPRGKDTRMEAPASYSEASFWEKVRTQALRAGREVVETALTLFHVLQDPETPKWARTVIIGALGYFILPTDAVPDLIPLVGFTDDLGALAAALATVGAHVKDRHIERAHEVTRRWFPEPDRGEAVPPPDPPA